MATNSDPRIRLVLESLRLPLAPENLFISWELEVEKPDREFFDKVAERFGVEKEELLYVGDEFNKFARWIALFTLEARELS